MKIISLKNKINDGDLEIRISIGENCNMSCYYCPANNSNLKFEKINELLDLIMRSKFKNLVLTFSGGEPLLYLNEIQNILLEVQKIYNKKLDIKILTNGVKILENNIINKLRFLNKLYQLEVIVSIHSTIENLKDQLQLLNENNILYYTRKPITKLMNNNNYENKINDIFPAYGNFDAIPKLGLKKQFIFNDVESNLLEIYKDTNLNFKGWECESGKDLICIDTNGKVYPCSIYLHNKFNGVEIEKFNQHETICELEECWCFTSCKRKK